MDPACAMLGLMRLRIEIEQEDDGRWLAEVANALVPYAELDGMLSLL
jgi:hypothetical protein